MSESKTGKNQEIGFELVFRRALPLMGAAVFVSFLSPATDGPHRSALPLPLPRFCLLRVSLATAPAGLGVGFLLSLCGSFKGLDIDAAPWLGRCAAVG